MGFGGTKAAEVPFAVDELVDQAAGFGGGGMEAAVGVLDEFFELGWVFGGEDEGFGVDAGFEGVSVLESCKPLTCIVNRNTGVSMMPSLLAETVFGACTLVFSIRMPSCSMRFITVSTRFSSPVQATSMRFTYLFNNAF